MQHHYRTQYGRQPSSDNAGIGYSNIKRMVCSALKRSRKIEHFAGRCSKPTKIKEMSFFAVMYTINDYRICHNLFHLYAYKVQTVKALKPDNKSCCIQFVKELLSNIKEGENYLWRWIFSDEAMFNMGIRKPSSHSRNQKNSMV
jgi:flagellin-specific chaperone FliS